MAKSGQTQKGFFLRIVLIVLGVFLLLATLNVSSQAIATLHELTRVEAERDQWQRPDEVLRALDLKAGGVAVDFGSGAGYFALKISKSVGDRGSVLAVDLRKVSLTFLWIRSRLQHSHNVSIVLGEADDPHLEANVADAVLIANTYHELKDPKPILGHLYRSLRPGGRLVVVDRDEALEAHEITAAKVESELAGGGFAVVRSDHDFIDRIGDHWWLIVAQKPQ